MCELDYCEGCSQCVTGRISTGTRAPTSDDSTANTTVEKDKMCKSLCRVENFPGTPELARASMCELDYCKGCSQCANLKGGTSIRTQAPTSDDSTASTTVEKS